MEREEWMASWMVEWMASWMALSGHEELIF
jgi:hypothetical protein